MRKTLALFLALVITLLSLYVVAFTIINSQKDNVIVTEEYIYGDKSYAENVDVNFKTLYKENIQWDIDFDIASGKAKTDFSIHKDRIDREYESINELRIYTNLHYSTFGNDIPMNNVGIDKAFEELRNEAIPYEEAKKVIYVSDYIDYYPVTVDASLENFYLDSSLHSHLRENETELIKAIESFFKIPVQKDHRIEIRLQIDENRNITHTGTATTTEDGTYEGFSFFANSVVTDKECFIYFDDRSDYGERADTSEIPGGYGIYRLPYSSVETNVTFDTENLKNIFPLKNGESIYQLELSADGKDLYMMSKKNNVIYLTVIDAETYEEKSKVIISDEKDQSSNIEYIGDDFIVIIHYSPDSESSEISVYTTDVKDAFEEKFTVDQYIYDDKSTITDEGLVYYAGGDFYLHGNQIDVKWDGERLYVTNSTGDNFSPVRKANFSLSVYDKNGLLFCGNYTTSLNTGYDGYQASGYYVNLSQYDLIKIKLS